MGFLGAGHIIEASLQEEGSLHLGGRQILVMQ